MGTQEHGSNDEIKTGLQPLPAEDTSSQLNSGEEELFREGAQKIGQTLDAKAESTEAETTPNEQEGSEGSESNEEQPKAEKPKPRKNFVPQPVLDKYVYRYKVAQRQAEEQTREISELKKQNTELIARFDQLTRALNGGKELPETSTPLTMEAYARLRQQEREEEARQMAKNAEIDNAVNWLHEESDRYAKEYGVAFPDTLEDDIDEIIRAEGWHKDGSKPSEAIKKAFDLYIKTNTQDVTEEQDEDSQEEESSAAGTNQAPTPSAKISKTPAEIRQEGKTKVAGSVQSRRPKGGTAKVSGTGMPVFTKDMDLKEMEAHLFPGDGSGMGKLFDR